MRKQKTSKKNRINYIYYTADGKKIQIAADDVGEEWITFLHEMDDNEFNAQRREDYHVPVHLDSYSETAGENVADHNKYLMDVLSDPLEQLIEKIVKEDHQEQLNKLMEAMKTLKPEQRELVIDKFYRKKSNVEIATAESVSEAAIRKRLKRIYKILSQKI